MPNVEQYKAQYLAERASAQALADKVLSTGEPFEAKPWTWSNLGPTALFAVLASAIGPLAVNADSVFGLWTASLLALLALVLGLLAWRSRSHVSLKFTKDGVDTASHGFIPWEAIKGLRPNHISRPPTRLQLLVPRLPDLVSQMKPGARLYYRMRFGQGRFELFYPLDYSLARARILAGAAQTLWEAKTGRKNTWVPNDPGLTRQLDQLYEAMPVIPKSDAPFDPEAALEQLKRLQKSHDNFQDYVQAQKAKSQKQTRWVVAIVGVCMITYIAFEVMR